MDVGQIIASILILFNSKGVPNLPPDPPNSLPLVQPVTTQSRFTEKLEQKIAIIAKKTTTINDQEMEAGEEKVIEEGADGQIVKTIKITFHQEEEYSREVVSTQNIPSKDKKIARGTKIIWKTLDSPDGQISYYRKMRVYATHYDSKCRGCNETTAIGMRAGYGVIAVDPTVIKLRSKVYIPGYGVAVAGDTGGTIQGNVIDLGFDDTRTAGWTARYVDIYLL